VPQPCPFVRVRSGMRPHTYIESIVVTLLVLHAVRVGEPGDGKCGLGCWPGHLKLRGKSRLRLGPRDHVTALAHCTPNTDARHCELMDGG
jgi:hypothetical protein